MVEPVILPDNFHEKLHIDNAQERLEEALDVAQKLSAAGVSLLSNPDHAAIFADPPHILAGPLKEIGYIAGWDTRCYPSPVDGHDYINVPSGLPENSLARNQGWFTYIAVVHPVDTAARDHMLAQGYGNPFIHHMTWGIAPPERGSKSDFEYAGSIIPYMIQTRVTIGQTLKEKPGTLIMALPAGVTEHPEFHKNFPRWVAGLEGDEYQVETMQGGGFLLQFFVLTGGRIEVALRVGTSQTFNPKSVDKISRDEISTEQSG
ncbi:MAG: hypothetical protein O2954_13060 [bacterium]|nr:hypothetical protein [bacterium]